MFKGRGLEVDGGRVLGRAKNFEDDPVAALGPDAEILVAFAVKQLGGARHAENIPCHHFRGALGKGGRAGLKCYKAEVFGHGFTPGGMDDALITTGRHNRKMAPAPGQLPFDRTRWIK